MILPELQWHERITIGANTVRLARNGRTANTRVNAGTWELPADPHRVAALFAQLGAVDRAAIQRVEPDDIPDGGGSEEYTLVYANGAQFGLSYTPGVIYTNGELIVQPVQAFLRGLQWPAEAASRYAV
jgi:hypothetical protein